MFYSPSQMSQSELEQPMSAALEQPMWIAPTIKVVEDGNTIAINCGKWPICITLCMTTISGGAQSYEFPLSVDELALCLTDKSAVPNFTGCRFVACQKSWSFDSHDTLRFALAMMLPVVKLGEIIELLAGSAQIVKHPTGLTAKMRFDEFSSGVVRFSDEPIKASSTVKGTTTGRTLEIRVDDSVWHLATDTVMFINDRAEGYMLESIVDSDTALQWKCFNRGLRIRGRSRSMIKMDMSSAYLFMLLIKLNAGRTIMRDSE